MQPVRTKLRVCIYLASPSSSAIVSPRLSMRRNGEGRGATVENWVSVFSQRVPIAEFDKGVSVPAVGKVTVATRFAFNSLRFRL